jgi:putative intracellular protease/amidase
MHKSTKTVLMIVANPATSPQTGWPVGFWWSELTHPYWVFKEAGYEVIIASPQGGAVSADSYSDPEDASLYAADDILSLGFKKSPRHKDVLANTPALADIKGQVFDAIYVVGGQSPMITMYEDKALQDFIAAHYEAGRITALVCHGTVLLLKTRLSDGSLLVKGKSWTGFSNAEEAYADKYAGKKIQPFWIEEEAGKLGETNFITSAPFAPFAVRDGHLITGQQQNSGTKTAKLVVEALGY